MATEYKYHAPEKGFAAGAKFFREKLEALNMPKGQSLMAEMSGIQKNTYGGVDVYSIPDSAAYAGMTEEQKRSYDGIRSATSSSAAQYKSSILQTYAAKWDYIMNAHQYDDPNQTKMYQEYVYANMMQDPIYLNYLSAQPDFQTKMKEYEDWCGNHTQIKAGVIGYTDEQWTAAGGHGVPANYSQMKDAIIQDFNREHWMMPWEDSSYDPSKQSTNILGEYTDAALEKVNAQFADFGLKMSKDGQFSVIDYNAGLTKSEINTINHIGDPTGRDKTREGYYNNIASQYGIIEQNCPTESPDKEIYQDLLLIDKMNNPGYLKYLEINSTPEDPKLQNFVSEYVEFYKEHQTNKIPGFPDSQLADAQALEDAGIKAALVMDQYDAAHEKVLGNRDRQLEADANAYTPNGTAADAAYYEGQARTEAEEKAKEEAQQNDSGKADPQSTPNTSDKNGDKSSEESKKNSPFESLKGGAVAVFATVKGAILNNPVGQWVVERMTALKDWVKAKADAIFNKEKQQTAEVQNEDNKQDENQNQIDREKAAEEMEKEAVSTPSDGGQASTEGPEENA